MIVSIGPGLPVAAEPAKPYLCRASIQPLGYIWDCYNQSQYVLNFISRES